MRTLNLLQTLFLLLACLSPVLVQAQEYDPYAKTYEERLDNFNNDLQETRDYFRDQDDQASRARNYKKIDASLQGFLETEFMKNYKELKLEIESQASAFKAQAQKLSPDKVVRVKKAYIQISDKFNKLLFDIKRDFLDRKKLKHISKYPDMYSASLELRLRNLKDDYSHDFARVVAEITGTDEFSATPFMAIFSIIRLAVGFTDYLAKMRHESRQMKEEHLDEFLVEPFRFRTWFEIEAVEANIYGDDDGMDDYDQQQGYDEYQPDPFQENPTSPEEDLNSLPPKKKKKNNGGQY